MTEVEKIIMRDLQSNEYAVPPTHADKQEHLASHAAQRIVRVLAERGFKIEKLGHENS